MALVGYSVVILCCIFVENVLEVEEENTGNIIKENKYIRNKTTISVYSLIYLFSV